MILFIYLTYAPKQDIYYYYKQPQFSTNSLRSNKMSFLQGDYNFKSQTVMNEIKGLIVPHAGLFYSGEIANQGYGKLNWDQYDRILILSTHHRSGTFLPESDSFQLEGNTYYFNHQGLEDSIEKSDKMFENEHSWLVQLPFLGKRFNITIILVNEYTDKMMNAILNIVKEDTLVVANTDLLHCGPNYNNSCPSSIERKNKSTIQKIIKGKPLQNESLCGKRVIELFMKIANDKKWIENETYYTSSDIIEPSENSVGYTTIVFKSLFHELLPIPRKVMESSILKPYLGKQMNTGQLQDLSRQLERQLSTKKRYRFSFGIFVTIEKNGILRGCIGDFQTRDTLSHSIILLTLKSAFFDNRFPVVEKDELNELSYKINFIKKPFTIYQERGNTIKEIYSIVKNSLTIGIHGIHIYYDEDKSATYLANVLIESFGIRNFTPKNWMKLEQSLRSKSGSLENSKIIRIDLYECEEYGEDFQRIRF